MENEQKTIDLIKDVASLLERAAVGPLHTPALYATFLKALISAKFEGTNTVLNSPPMNVGTSINGMNLQANSQAISNTVEERNVGVKPNILGANSQMFNPMDFSAGEMGPVMDMSTFPPRMAPQTEEPPSQLLSMDSILSSDFWDSVLVPGMLHILTSAATTISLISSPRLLKFFRRSQWGICIWFWWKFHVYCISFRDTYCISNGLSHDG